MGQTSLISWAKRNKSLDTSEIRWLDVRKMRMTFVVDRRRVNSTVMPLAVQGEDLMKHPQFFCSLVALLFAICLFDAALAQESAQTAGGEITTLYALDPITSHLSLNDG